MTGCASNPAIQPSPSIPAIIDTKLAAAASQQMDGQYRLAAESLAEAEKLSTQIDDPHRRIAVLESLGVLYTLDSDLEQQVIATQPSSQPATMAAIDVRKECSCGPKFAPRDAYSSLTEAMRLCQEIHDQRAEASVVINLGNYQSSKEQFTDAIDSYQRAGELAAAVGDNLLLAHALANTANANASAATPTNADPEPDAAEVLAQGLIAARYLERAIVLAEKAADALATVPDTSTKAQILITAAQSIVRFNKEARGGLDTARGLLQKATIVATNVTDARSLSYAYGELGRVYELRGNTAEALANSRTAIAKAQEAQSPESLYRWQWQTARLLRATDLNASVSTYRQAVATLQTIRNDLALRHGNRSRSTSFRKDVGQLYFELADVLFQQAGKPGSETSPAVEAALIDARATVETLKSAELEDYFQDSCTQQRHTKIASIDAVAPKTAVVYYIPLPDRLEILLNTSSGLHRCVSPVKSSDLDSIVRRMREELVVQTSRAYLTPSRELYHWLIEPIQSQLDAEQVDTLVFVPDGSLATVPMAAIEDGKQFLIEKYAIAVTPGLTLVDPKPTPRRNATPLLSGLSVSVQGFDALGYVPQELASVQQVYGGHELLNEQFVLQNMQRELASHPYSIVHVASHAQFGKSARDTFLLTYDGRIDLNDLQNLIEPKKLNGQPVELLTLSACETAAGDDRAALGLAGVAVKSGARSVLATLWSVNDEAASALMTRFYTELRNDPSLSKAKAMQRAQLQLLGDKRYRHPLFWSPYLIIGNWL